MHGFPGSAADPIHLVFDEVATHTRFPFGEPRCQVQHGQWRTAGDRLLLVGLEREQAIVDISQIKKNTQKIKDQYAGAWGSDTAEKVAIFGALSLYLDFVNLFQFLMMFLGQERE